MALILKAALDFYNKATGDWADPRTKDYPLLGHPEKIIAIVTVYLLFCLKIGPKFMENREPYNVKKYIILYNIIQILCNGFLAIKILPLELAQDWRCSPIDYQNPDCPMLYYVYIFFLLKVLDLLDTVFFVLKKNHRQITFLHVYHHAMMVLMFWMGMTYFCGGHSVYLAGINTIVHTVMYSYYLLCVLSEKHRKSNWWKKYITQIQIVQFGVFFLLYFQLLFRSCAYPKGLTLLIVLQNGIVTYLFLNFYYKTYMRKKKC